MTPSQAIFEKLRFWLFILIPFIFQMSDAVFMGLSAEISSDLSFHSQDILYCGFAGMIGVTMTFPILFRLKFRFTPRAIFLITSLGLASICSVCLFIRSLPLLVVLSFLFGMLKLWGSFEAFSSIMQKVSPNYNFAPFLAVVFSVVFGGIELSGAVSKVVTHLSSWEYMSYLMIGCLLVVALISFFLMPSYREMPPKSLKGIDWTGLILWGVTLLGAAFIFVYGEMLDWFNSRTIWTATFVVIVCLGINLTRMRWMDNPYLEFKAFTYYNMGKVLMLFFIAAILMSAESVLQHIYVGEILGFGPYTQVSLNLVAFVGVLAGGFIGFYAIDRLGAGFKIMTLISILLLTMYEISMWTLISSETAVTQLLLPMFFYGMGHSLLFVVLTTYIEGVVPMEHRFQSLTVLGFVRIGCGAAFGSALLGHLFYGAVKMNLAQLSSNLNPDIASEIPFSQMAEIVSREAVMVSIRDIYTIMIFIGVVTMLILLIILQKNKLALPLENI